MCSPLRTLLRILLICRATWKLTPWKCRLLKLVNLRYARKSNARCVEHAGTVTRSLVRVDRSMPSGWLSRRNRSTWEITLIRALMACRRYRMSRNTVSRPLSVTSRRRARYGARVWLCVMVATRGVDVLTRSTPRWMTYTCREVLLRTLAMTWTVVNTLKMIRLLRHVKFAMQWNVRLMAACELRYPNGQEYGAVAGLKPHGLDGHVDLGPCVRKDGGRVMNIREYVANR